MKKFILVPDSFKGTLSSTEICNIMAEEIASVFPQAEIYAIPVADGGEGTVDAFLTAVGGEKKKVIVKGPYGESIEAFYGKLNDTLAVVEMAAAARLPLVEDNPAAEKTTTYGVGQLIEAAAKTGFDRLLQGADLVLTGEGRIDGQSLRGKVVVGVARRCQSQNMSVVAVVGDIADGAEAVYDAGVTAIFSINRRPMPFSESRFLSHHNMRLTMKNLIRLLSRL